MSSGFLVGRSASGRDNTAQVTDDGALKVDIAGLQIPPYDYIDLSYTGTNLTGVVYKEGGASGTTVATLTLSYDGSNNLISVAKS